MTNPEPSHLDAFMQEIEEANPHQDEFVQAVREAAADIFEYIDDKPRYRRQQILRRMAEPDRIVSFRVCWEDDEGDININRGWRVQNNNAIGPYKGGIRFHPSVDESVLKFLAFEQTFKNALTGLPMGGGKGGSNFDPKGKSDREIMRFCQSFMTELYRHIGPDTDVPAGDIGVGAREIGYMFGQYKRITGEWEGVLTGKGREYGGSQVRPEATGWGAVYFLREMLRRQDKEIDGLTACISGAGNVATHAAEKFVELGGKVLTLSDSGGYVHDPDGFDADKIEWVRRHKEDGGRMEAYPDEYDGATFQEGEHPWGVECDVAVPCATQNELDGNEAKTLLDNGCIAVCEGANMPCTADAVEAFLDAQILYAPGKASNAGGVAVSGLEISQNVERRSWSREELEESLCAIMKDIHAKCVEYGCERDDNGGEEEWVNYVRGANVAGFRKVADAMLSFGVV